MSQICCLLDACVAINLIHISDDDFLLKKLNKLEIHIDDSVFNEIRLNVFERVDSKGSKYVNKEELANIRKTIDQKLTFFRSKKNNTEELLNNTGRDYFTKIKEITAYAKKINGELCSTAYALYLSRLNEKKIFFYTDDYPAKEYFLPFFEYQQIGQIKDSVDLLILLFWLDENFTEQQLDNTLSELYSQYTTQVTLLNESLKSFYHDKVDGKFIRAQKDVADKIRMLINKLDNLDFNNIGKMWLFFEGNKAKCKGAYEVIKPYYSVFGLEKNLDSETIIGKIMRTRNLIAKNKIYKWNDLLNN